MTIFWMDCNMTECKGRKDAIASLLFRLDSKKLRMEVEI